MSDNSKLPLVFKGEDFLFAFANFVGSELGKRNLNILTKREHRISSDQFSYRIINHWEKNELIDNNRPEGKGWRKFSIVDLVWINIIRELRGFGYAVEKIREVKENLNWTQGKGKFNTPELEYYISLIISHKVPVFAVVFGNGIIEIVDDAQYKTSVRLLNLRNHIKINLNSILQLLFPTADLSPEFENRPALNDEEMELLMMIRLQDYESIKVIRKSGKIEFIEAKENINPEKLITDVINQDDFQDIEIKQTDGKIVSLKRTVRKKL